MTSFCIIFAFEKWVNTVKANPLFTNETDESPIPEENKLRLWPRFFARVVDNFLAVTLISIFFLLAFNRFPNILELLINPIANVIVCLFIWVFIESIFISKFGQTLGKWLFNIKVISPNNDLSYPKALLRSFKVYGYGMAIGLPILCLFMMAFAANNVKKTGSTS